MGNVHPYKCCCFVAASCQASSSSPMCLSRSWTLGSPSSPPPPAGWVALKQIAAQRGGLTSCVNYCLHGGALPCTLCGGGGFVYVLQQKLFRNICCSLCSTALQRPGRGMPAQPSARLDGRETDEADVTDDACMPTRIASQSTGLCGLRSSSAPQGRV